MYTSHMQFKKMAASSILCMELFYLAVLVGASLHSSTNGEIMKCTVAFAIQFTLFWHYIYIVHEQKRANSDWHDCCKFTRVIF